MNAALRSSKKTARLASVLNTVRASESSRRLPPSVSALECFQTSSAAKRIAREALPGIQFSNPDVRVVVTTAPRRSAGVEISFSDSSRKVFYPLFSKDKSPKLVKSFLETIQSPEALAALGEASASSTSPPSEQPPAASEELLLDAEEAAASMSSAEGANRAQG